MVEGKIPMAARRQVTNKLRTVYARASKRDKARILDEVMSTTGMGWSTARRMLTGQVLSDPAEQVDKRKLRPKEYSDDSRSLLEHVWALMGCPCGKYLVVMRGLWLPLLAEAGDLDKPFATAEAITQLQAMSAATIDRYLAPARKSMQLRGISTTKPSPLLRNSIGLSKVGDEPATTPGVIEADTVAHCGPTFQGEFTRTLTMTDLVTGWTENASIRNNASQCIVKAVAALEGMFPFPLLVFDSDNGSEFINHDVANWLQERDIAQTRSRPYKKNDQATVESKNNHVVRKHAFYWRYDTTADGRRKRLYDKPKTPWQRVQESSLLTAEQLRVAHARIAGVNPADLTRRINQIQLRLTELSRNKTETMTTSRHLNMASLETSIRRLQTTK